MSDIIDILVYFALPWLIFVAGMGLAAVFALTAVICHHTAETIDAE
ncbi:MAG: hypothetical protein ACOCXA_01360 [Planctomycetota bacterium]